MNNKKYKLRKYGILTILIINKKINLFCNNE